MKKEDATTQARLCIARRALTDIVKYKPDDFEDYQETVTMLKFYAENAIREMLECGK